MAVISYALATAVLLVTFLLVVTVQNLPRLVARGRALVSPRHPVLAARTQVAAVPVPQRLAA